MERSIRNFLQGAFYKGRSTRDILEGICYKKKKNFLLGTIRRDFLQGHSTRKISKGHSIRDVLQEIRHIEPATRDVLQVVLHGMFFKGPSTITIYKWRPRRDMQVVVFTCNPVKGHSVTFKNAWLLFEIGLEDSITLLQVTVHNIA